MMLRRLGYVVLTVAFFAACEVWAQSSNATPAPPATPPANTTAPEQKMPEVADAVALFQKRDFDGARALLEKAVKKYPDLPPAYVLLAQLFSQANLPLGVRNSLERAVIGSPDDPEVYVILGDFALQEGRVTEANLLYNTANQYLKSFDKSARRKSILQPRTLSGLAQVAETRGDWALAQKYLESLLTQSPADAGAMQRMARALFQQKEAQKSLDMLRKASDADKNVLTPEATLATFYEQFGDHKNAKVWMDRALTKKPDDLRTRLVAAQWALETNQMDDLKTHAAKALNIEPQSVDAKVLRGAVALFQKDYRAAEDYFQSAHLQSPGNATAANYLALALCEQKSNPKLDQALQYAETNVRQYPKMAEAYATYGWVLYKAGRIDQAEQALRTAASSGNITPDTAYYLAKISAERGRKDDAKKLLEAALTGERPFLYRSDAKDLLSSLK